MSGGKRLAGSKTAKKPDLSQFSKWMIADIRPLLWVVTVGGLLLAAYCIRVGYTGSLPLQAFEYIVQSGKKCIVLVGFEYTF